MDIKPIKTDADLRTALARFGALMESDPIDATAEHDELLVLADLIEVYEARHHALPPADPIAAIEFRLRERGSNQRELSKATGIQESKISEVMNRRRPINLAMARILGPALDIPLATMASEYPLDQETAELRAVGPAGRTRAGTAART